MGCKDPRSWYYQGAIHWIPTKPADILAIWEENPLCPYYSEFPIKDDSLTSGSDKLLASWDNCAHGTNQAGQSAHIHFLPWHRLYLDSFEEIVRKLSDDKNFSLPYWDYISLFDIKLPDKKRLTMPEEFYNQPDECNPSFNNCNSLYESGRGWRLVDLWMKL
ncbi:MAG: tyrosinase family protein [Okeania sp. SIO3H1]|nr:tyrosinase family protein [Okeania sp. SIO3H1]